ncbi:MAG: IS630 family transposase [Thermomicrobia bacterium]|nr:IS630 family transposase [Thermomicrobia bacterium]MCA1722676.1 IS630 family transposase [Thermomicrobia bacterium]
MATERDETARAAWRAMAAVWKASSLIFVDESGTQTNMTPRTSRAPRGQRAYGVAPRSHGKNTTLIAALCAQGMGAAMTLEGAADADAFVAYLTDVLVPTLMPGQIVVMDNLSVHKDKRVAPLIAGVGCQLVYLPAYSPDMTPIEQAFSKVKALLRRMEARTREALEAAITTALGTITTRDAAGWFTACGYPLTSAQ